MPLSKLAPSRLTYQKALLPNGIHKGGKPRDKKALQGCIWKVGLAVSTLDFMLNALPSGLTRENTDDRKICAPLVRTNAGR